MGALSAAIDPSLAAATARRNNRAALGVIAAYIPWCLSAMACGWLAGWPWAVWPAVACYAITWVLAYVIRYAIGGVSGCVSALVTIVLLSGPLLLAWPLCSGYWTP
jgi:hypothetical protein